MRPEIGRDNVCALGDPCAVRRKRSIDRPGAPHRGQILDDLPLVLLNVITRQKMSLKKLILTC
jgi:hypothetical protein